MTKATEVARKIRSLARCGWPLSHAKFLFGRAVGRNRNELGGLDNDTHLLAAIDWLERAQDVTGDGGVCGRYSLSTGWTSSYPETTGYIIPTFLRLHKEFGETRFQRRAEQAVEFLLPLQLPNGAFPGLEIAQNRTKPSPFDSAQIINGLLAWYEETGDSRALDSAVRAGEWIIQVQDDDGAWRKHFYQGHAATYAAHLCCWLADLGQTTSRNDILVACSKHLDWVLRHRDPETGWIDLSGFSDDDHQQRRSVVHTLAYTICGILHTAEVLDRQDGIDAANQAALAVARRLELSRVLPGVLDYRWRKRSNYTCLTGNAQMALIWFRLQELFGDVRLVSAACKALDSIKRAQPIDSSNPDIRGSIPGSDPPRGDYIRYALPNWAAKFFIDAMLEQRKTLDRVANEKPGNAGTCPPTFPTEFGVRPSQG